MAENWIYYVKFAVIIILVFFFVKGLIRNSQLRRFFRQLKNAEPISADVQKGDYVNFSGTLAVSDVQMPVSKKKCGYWGVIIRAVFQTKQKKPGKGLDTHRPVIYKNESDVLPFIVTTQDHLVHLAIDKPLRFMVNMKSKISKTAKVSMDEAKEFIKPKYTEYETSEYWLPENTNLHIWGTVSGINKNCLSISSANDTKIPTLIYNGVKKDIFSNFSFRLFILFLLMVFSPVAIYGLLVADSYLASDTYILIADVAALLIGFTLYRVGRIHFVK